MNNIYLYGADKAADLKQKKAVKQLIQDLFSRENTRLERLNYIFCSDEYLLKMNKQFLNHSTLTDVITFPFSENGKPVHVEVWLNTRAFWLLQEKPINNKERLRICFTWNIKLF